MRQALPILAWKCGQQWVGVLCKKLEIQLHILRDALRRSYGHSLLGFEITINFWIRRIRNLGLYRQSHTFVADWIDSILNNSTFINSVEFQIAQTVKLHRVKRYFPIAILFFDQRNSYISNIRYIYQAIKQMRHIEITKALLHQQIK